MTVGEILEEIKKLDLDEHWKVVVQAHTMYEAKARVVRKRRQAEMEACQHEKAEWVHTGRTLMEQWCPACQKVVRRADSSD